MLLSTTVGKHPILVLCQVLCTSGLWAFQCGVALHQCVQIILSGRIGRPTNAWFRLLIRKFGSTSQCEQDLNSLGHHTCEHTQL